MLGKSSKNILPNGGFMVISQGIKSVQSNVKTNPSLHGSVEVCNVALCIPWSFGCGCYPLVIVIINYSLPIIPNMGIGVKETLMTYLVRRGRPFRGSNAYPFHIFLYDWRMATGRHRAGIYPVNNEIDNWKFWFSEQFQCQTGKTTLLGCPRKLANG